MLKYFLIRVILLLFLAGCQPFFNSTPAPKVKVIDYPPVDWSIGVERLAKTGCMGVLQENCAELIRLGCDEIGVPFFYAGGLQPPYPIGECVHRGETPPNPGYFRQPQGLDTRYRSLVVFQEDGNRLIIKRSEFREIFAPIDSAEEALSYAMAVTSLTADFSIDPNANEDYLVKVIEETHVEESEAGYVVYLFDFDRRMGCDVHTHFAVNVLVTREGDVQELKREAIYKSYICVDFGRLMLDED